MLFWDAGIRNSVATLAPINSALPAAQFLTTTAAGSVNAARGTWGCVIPPLPPTQSSSLCVILYSLPGTVDYPWSVAYSVNFQYYPSAVTTSSGTGVTIVSGSGTRTFTNRFGISFATPVTVDSFLPQNGALIYTGQPSPFDLNGITFQLASPVQLPGGDSLNPVAQLTLTSVNGAIVEAGSALQDALAQAFLSGVPGAVNTTIGASNINTLAANYAQCLAPISFTNGLRAPTQPSSSNGGTRIAYTYTLSDGATYSVTTSMLLTAVSGFGTSRDQLGSPYQTVSGITGNRTYTYLPTGATVTSVVTGLSTAAPFGSNPPDFRFYPYALLSSSPGVYTSNSVPFLDADGLAFTITPAAPALGAAIGFSQTYSTFSVAVTANASSANAIAGSTPFAVMTETPLATAQPLFQLQRQTYLFG